MRERVLAILGAVALVALAIFVRGLVIDKDDGGGKGSGGRKGSAERPVVACTPDLATICTALADQGDIAANPPSLDLDQAGDPAKVKGIDGWITWSPAPQVANFINDPGGTSGPWSTDPPGVLGTADAVVVVRGAARQSVASTCGPLTWACLAGIDPEVATFGLGESTTAEGLARIAPLAEGSAGSLSKDDIDANALTTIVEGPVQGGGESVVQQLKTQATIGAAALGVVVAPSILAKQAASSARDQAVLVPTPSRHLSIVAAGRAGSSFDAGGWCKQRGVGVVLSRAGVEPCAKADIDTNLAGFLFQVRKALT